MCWAKEKEGEWHRWGMKSPSGEVKNDDQFGIQVKYRDVKAYFGYNK